MADDTHPCPGGCGARIIHKRLACTACWMRLPKPLRGEIVDSYYRQRDDPARHRDAIAEAAQWYRDNPRPAAR